MKSRILSLLAVAGVLAGCAQTPPVVAPASESPPPETATTEATPEITPDVTPEKAPDVDDAAQPVVDVVVIEEPGTERVTVIRGPDTGETKGPSPEDKNSIGTEQPGDEESPPAEQLVQTDEQKKSVIALCNEIGNKLGSVSVEDCLAEPLHFAGSYTVQSRPMVVRDFLPAEAAEKHDKKTRILIMGGIHGDEYSSISIMFKWMTLLERSNNRDFQWRFAPTVNPDGLLDGQAVRQNANGVDLNRNFPSRDWTDLAEEYWLNTTNRNPRRYPGAKAASEPEVQWIVNQIETFKPDVIVSVHAPYHLLDYDGPQDPPKKLGVLHLHLLGVYPGSLGNYAGIDLGIPVVTMELPSAGIMPTSEQIVTMWNDLLAWLYNYRETGTG